MQNQKLIINIKIELNFFPEKYTEFVTDFRITKQDDYFQVNFDHF